MTHLQNFIDVVLAIVAVEAILKPITVRLTKKLLEQVDEKVGFIPDYLHTEQED